MSVSLIGMVVICAAVILVFAAPDRIVWLLSAVAPLTRTAAVTVAGNAVSPFYLVAAIVAVLLVVQWATGKIHVSWKNHLHHLLGVFLAWSLLVTLAAPTLFGDILVLDPRGGIDAEVLEPTRLGYSISNVAQSAYLILAVGVVLFLATRPRLSPAILTPAAITGTVLSALRLLPGSGAVMDPLFRNFGSTEFNVYETRHFGIFFEPSYLATFSLAALAYCFFRARVVRGARRFALVGLGLLAMLNLVLSSSGTAAVSGVLLVIGLVIFSIYRFLFRGGKLHPMVLVAILGIIALAISDNPVSREIQETIVSKLGTTSYVSRTSADTFSLNLVAETFGLGVGIGSNRPSSFLALLLSTTGVIGFILLTVFMWRVIKGALARPEWVPVATALVALFAAKVIAEPDLSSPMMWMCAGACLFSAGRADSDVDARADAHAVAPPETLSVGRSPSDRVAGIT